jgi:hypothetical protein
LQEKKATGCRRIKEKKNLVEFRRGRAGQAKEKKKTKEPLG